MRLEGLFCDVWIEWQQNTWIGSGQWTKKQLGVLCFRPDVSCNQTGILHCRQVYNFVPDLVTKGCFCCFFFSFSKWKVSRDKKWLVLEKSFASWNYSHPSSNKAHLHMISCTLPITVRAESLMATRVHKPLTADASIAKANTWNTEKGSRCAASVKRVN